MQSRNGDDGQDAPYFFLQLYLEQYINQPRVKTKTTKLPQDTTPDTSIYICICTCAKEIKNASDNKQKTD